MKYNCTRSLQETFARLSWHKKHKRKIIYYIITLHWVDFQYKIYLHILINTCIIINFHFLQGTPTFFWAMPKVIPDWRKPLFKDIISSWVMVFRTSSSIDIDGRIILVVEDAVCSGLSSSIDRPNKNIQKVTVSIYPSIQLN